MEAVKTISDALKTLDVFNCAFVQHQSAEMRSVAKETL